MEEAVWDRLLGGLWHTTSRDRFLSILRDGAILPEPDLPDSERWNTRIGSDGYPYARSLGGVSLFDFYGFDYEAYQQKYPLSSIATFVPFLRSWGHAAWIEIDRRTVASSLIQPADLVARWKADNAYRQNIMPHVEAAHLGSIPTSAFAGGFMIDQDFVLAELELGQDDK